MVRTLTEPHILTSSSDIDSTYDAQVFHSTPYIMSPYHPLQSSEEIGTLSESHVLSIAQKNLDYV